MSEHNNGVAINSIPKGNEFKAVTFNDGEDMDNWQLVQPSTPNESHQTLQDFDQWRVTKEKNIPQPLPTITIGGAAVASPGNITGISAASKAGKTAFTGVLLAGAISTDGDIDGFNDVEVMPNIEGKAVIHMDTEQSEADQQQAINSILRRAHFECTPDYYRAYNIRQLKPDTYQNFTDQICELSNERFNGIHLIVIDGGADYIKSVNDEAEANDIVQYYTHLSIKYDCPVIIIVHTNPGSEKERGHFGSQVQRKCYGLLSITKDDNDISTVQAKIMRKAGNGDVPLINFKYSKDLGYHVEVDVLDKASLKDVQAMMKLKAVADIIFNPPTALTHGKAVSEIMKHTNKKDSTAKTMLTNMVGFEFVEKGSDNNYRLVLPNIIPNDKQLQDGST